MTLTLRHTLSLHQSLKKVMTKYSVKKLSQMAGISVRTLHHYDKIGLLKPAFRSDKGYRYYQRKQLLALQQILFFKELGFPLEKIRAVLEDPEFDLLKALYYHRKQLQLNQKRLGLLLKTVDKTILELKNKKEMMDDKDIYEGFSKEQKEAIRMEVAHRWGKDELEATEDRIRALGKEGWQDHKKKGEEINHLLADLIDLEPESPQVQQAIALHHRYMNLFYEVTVERYRGLAQMYVSDDRFKAYYEKYKEGLAEFIKAAILIYCENGMKAQV